MADHERISLFEIVPSSGPHPPSRRLAARRSAGPPKIRLMARRTAAKIVPPAVIFLFTGTLIFSTILVEAQEEPEPTDQELAEKFAPILSLMFALAVLMNGLHSYAIRNAAGLNSFTVILTWSSVLILVAVMAWSLRRQRLCIEKELLDEIPESLYVTVTEPWAGTKQQ